MDEGRKMMKKLILKGTDLELSNVCLGTANFGEKLTKEQAYEVLDTYVAAGGNFIDSANVYCKWIEELGNCSEQYLGSWLGDRKAYNKVVIATKGGHYDFKAPEISRVREETIRADLEESLQTLGVDHIDFYWLHRDDESVDITEIVDIMETLVKEGKIRYYGASNYKQYRIEQAVSYAEEKGFQGFTAVSNQWSMARVNPGGNMNQDPSLVLMDSDYYQWHKRSKMPIIPFSSSAHGFFDKLDRKLKMAEDMKRAYMNQDNLEMYQTLCKLRKETGVSLYALSIAWLTNQPFQTLPVAAVSRPEQLDDFVVASSLKLEKDVIEKYSL